MPTAPSRAAVTPECMQVDTGTTEPLKGNGAASGSPVVLSVDIQLSLCVDGNKTSVEVGQVRVKSDDAVTVGRPSAQVSVPLHWSPAHTGAFLIQFLIDELEKQLDQIDEKERGIKAKLATLQDRHPDDSDLQQAQEALQGLQKWKSMAYEHYRGLVGQAIQGGVPVRFDKEKLMARSREMLSSYREL
ncbi:unnamed protein product [Vitrella brassicaformis CCMP3155]|uniref:Uncharacterized protein n=1 Tax=Vitrella brassicaformis (strain CCMP3155) TaxID=1169540 RepID=A0A0G4GF35_VITBC|nr:unnamed protein product [Vitrella brassicaformis CCMP3155]|eukprot:CEM28124.1 unnamed protein product [Vitrella brassicaformis CCMP3155]